MTAEWIVLKNGKRVVTEFAFLSEGDARRYAEDASYMEYSATFSVAQVTTTFKRGAKLG